MPRTPRSPSGMRHSLCAFETSLRRADDRLRAPPVQLDLGAGSLPFRAAGGRTGVARRLNPGPSLRSLSLARLDRLDVLEAFHRVLHPEHSVVDAGGVERRPRLVGELVEVREELLDLLLDGHEQP